MGYFIYSQNPFLRFHVQAVNIPPFPSLFLLLTHPFNFLKKTERFIKDAVSQH